MNVKPLGDRVIIKEHDFEVKTKGGLMLSDNIRTHKTGEVVAIGAGIYTHTGTLVPLTVKVGDTVCYVPNTGQTLKIQNEDFILCREGDLIMIEYND